MILSSLLLCRINLFLPHHAALTQVYHGLRTDKRGKFVPQKFAFYQTNFTDRSRNIKKSSDLFS